MNPGPFDACFIEVDPSRHFENCKYDICAGGETDTICDDIVNYVFDCRAAGVNISGNWRDSVPPCGKMSLRVQNEKFSEEKGFIDGSIFVDGIRTPDPWVAKRAIYH